MRGAPRILPASDACWLVLFDESDTPEAAGSVRRFAAALRREPLAGVTDLVPAFASVLVRFDPRRVAGAEVRAGLEDRIAVLPDRSPSAGRAHEIPVVYGDAEGPDLGDVARASGLSEQEVVALHAGAEYEVRFLGFAPGFPYLSGLPARLETARLAVPRKLVPAGSVAIAGRYAGIYPRATPGGWRVLGRTPRLLFDPRRDPPAVLAAGDRVRFVPERRR